MHHPTDRIIHTTAIVTPVVEHWMQREIAQWVGRNEANVLFIDAFDTFYLRLYGVRYMVQKRGNPLPPQHGLLWGPVKCSTERAYND